MPKKIFKFTIAFFLLTACQASVPSTEITQSPPTATEAIAENTETVQPIEVISTETSALSTPTAAPSPIPPTAIPPTTIPPTPISFIELEGTMLPPGFSIIKFADIYRPTSITFDKDGHMFVTSVDSNIYILFDDDRDGRADSNEIYASEFSTPLGITVQPSTGDIYVSHQGVISVLLDSDKDGFHETKTTLVTDLPFGRHQNDNLKFGPDGWLYIGVGSTCDVCYEIDPRSASIMRFNVETGESEVFATGLRNPYDLAFHPVTGDLFATDNGRDDLGLDAPGEELNHIVENGDFGFPDCWDDFKGPGCDGTIGATAFFEPHASANGLDFYTEGAFPSEYHSNAFVSIFGSFLKPEVQTGIVRVMLAKEGEAFSAATEWFVQFPTGVMPLPLLVGPDGAIYVGDYINSAIYRISYGFP